MIRKIIQIDEEKCSGCGACAAACHEGAIGMVDGKAKLLREDYCDGLGDCLPACPADAIRFTVREAAAYDEEAVRKSKQKARPCGCPGTAARPLDPSASRLAQWPVQIRLVAPNASFFRGASLLIAADCTAYACGDFHERFMKDRVTLIGCPKLDNTDYSEKLTEIFKSNEIADLTVVRMEVPCCSGLVMAVEKALEACGKAIPLRTYVLSSEGRIIREG